MWGYMYSCRYKIVKLDYKMSSSSANGASTTYILIPSLALVHHHFAKYISTHLSLFCTVLLHTEEQCTLILWALFQAYIVLFQV